MAVLPVVAAEAPAVKPAKAKHAPAKPAPAATGEVLNLLKSPVTLDASAAADLDYLRKNTQPGIPYVLNMAHPAQQRHFIRALNLAGETEERSPQLHARVKALAAAAPPNGEALAAMVPVSAVQDNGALQPINAITNLANSGGSNFTASALSSVNGGTQSTTVITTLYGFDAQQNPSVYATNTGRTQTQGNYFQSSVAGTDPLTAQNPTTEAEAMFAYVPAGSKVPDPIVIYYRAQDTVNPVNNGTCMSQPQYCVRNAYNNCVTGQYQTACTNTVPNTTPIKICWNRGSQQECDYWNAGAHPANYFFPLQGSATFSSAIFSPPTGIATIYLVLPGAGGGCYLVNSASQPLGTGWSLSNNNLTLNFNFPSETFPNTNGCIGSGTFNTNLMVQVDGLVLQNSQYASFRFTSDRSLIGKPGVSIVPVMQIQDGCFAEGTVIGMAQGGDKTIESVAIGDMVRTADGKLRQVTDITTGVEPKAMIRITTADNRTVLVTETHPLATRGKPVMAKDVVAGQEIRTETGFTTVARLSSEPFAGKVYNLRIGTEADAKAGRTMLLANGLAAGDVAAQQLIEKLAAPPVISDASAPLDRIHPDWRIDFERHHPGRL
jgi:hypothetical protein